MVQVSIALMAGNASLKCIASVSNICNSAFEQTFMTAESLSNNSFHKTQYKVLTLFSICSYILVTFYRHAVFVGNYSTHQV